MTQAALRHAAMWRRAESLRQRTITVVVLDDEFAGALAYALERALEEPAAGQVSDTLLADLRRHAQCALIEVDEDAQIVQISGAGRWSYVADGESVQVGTDQASRVPPPGA